MTISGSFAGFKRAKGNMVFTLDADLEEPPEILEDFFKFLNSNEQANIVVRFSQLEKVSFSKSYWAKSFTSSAATLLGTLQKQTNSHYFL